MKKIGFYKIKCILFLKKNHFVPHKVDFVIVNNQQSANIVPPVPPVPLALLVHLEKLNKNFKP